MRVTSKAAAIRYARALFDVATKEQADLQQVETHLAAVANVFSQHPTLAKVLLNPAVPVPRKRAAVEELTARLGTVSMVAKLMALLAGRDRLVVLPDLLASYRSQLLAHQNVVRAEVTTAVPLSSEREREFERRLADVTGKTVTVSAKVDPAIVGGIVTRIGSTVYDASITKQLEKLRSRLVEG